MPLSVFSIENKVFLRFDGNLDVSLSRDIFRVCGRISAGLKSCVIDLSDTARLFDSGLALLQVLHRRLVDNGTAVVIQSARPEIGERVAATLNQDVSTPAFRVDPPRKRAFSASFSSRFT